MAKVFFSYSHRDEEMRDELETHLAMLKRQGLVEAIHDRRIPAGSELDATIDRYLEEADVVLCLVSPDFIASDYCYSREMTRALERHRSEEARVIPVILRHCDWRSTPLAGLRGTPRDNKPVKAWPDRDEAWLDVTSDVRTALATLGAAAVTPVGVGTPSLSREAQTRTRPRSANVAVAREFSDYDFDNYLNESFEFLSEFFANSLDELRVRNAGVEGAMRMLDANRFTAVAYRDGKKLAAITVFMGGMSRSGREISYHLTDSGATNTSNGSFRVTDDDQRLGFKGSFETFTGSRENARDREGMAERIWSAFVDPLQRSR